VELTPTTRTKPFSSTRRLIRTCTIEIVAGPDAGMIVRVDRPVFRVGSHRSNDLVLRDETVSNHHLELSLVNDGYKVLDLSSSNGTWFGSARLRELTVVEPMTLRLGATSLAIMPAVEEAEVPAAARTRFGSCLGRSFAMRELFAQLEAVAQSDCTVLLEGETGVGKELVAESIHKESKRSRGPFVVVDCAALAGELLEAELFGHVRGAFTGADAARRGLLETATGGTVFLDEVGELPLPLQAKLLGAIERRKVVPLGSSVGRPIDVRVISATNRNLGQEVNLRRFRADLFYRLAVVRLRVPPLRERLDDIPLLVESFLAALPGDVPRELSAIAIGRLTSQPWPGNVRELRNAVERAALQIPQAPNTPLPPPPSSSFFDARAQALDRFERSYFGELLSRAQGNLSQAARLSELDRRYLHRLLRRAGLL
jgi:transcriptional regulator with GAF, ATPase, and Fis domain